MKKVVFTSIVLVSLLILALRFLPVSIFNLLGIQVKAGLKVISTPEQATVFIDGVEVGKTTYQNENLKVGQYKIKLVSDGAVWQGDVGLTAGMMTVVNRELSDSPASASGEILTLQPGQGIIVISTPQDAVVEIDGKSYGRTPLLVSDIEPGEHTFLISHNGYLKRSIRATLPKDLSLQLSVDLALSELDLTNGNIPAVTTVTKLIVRQTPTGFLRVRDKPSLSGVEIGRVNSGEDLILVKELSGWDKARLNDGTEGYVSSVYVQKQP